MVSNDQMWIIISIFSYLFFPLIFCSPPCLSPVYPPSKITAVDECIPTVHLHTYNTLFQADCRVGNCQTFAGHLSRMFHYCSIRCLSTLFQSFSSLSGPSRCSHSRAHPPSKLAHGKATQIDASSTIQLYSGTEAETKLILFSSIISGRSRSILPLRLPE